MARNTRKTSKPNGRKLSKRKGNKKSMKKQKGRKLSKRKGNKKSMKKQKGGGSIDIDLSSAISNENIKGRFNSALYEFFRDEKMDDKKIDDLVKLFTEGIKYEWGYIKPSLDTRFEVTVRGSFIEKLEKRRIVYDDDYYKNDYNTMHSLIAKYPERVASFIDGLEKARDYVSTQFLKKIFNQENFTNYLQVACKFLPDDRNINLIKTLIEMYETYNKEVPIKDIINATFRNIHIMENCFLTLMNVHNADKEDRVIEAMKLLIDNGADEKYITEKSAGVTGWLAYKGNALTKAKELNAERDTKGTFTEVIDYLKNLGLTDPQEKAENIRLGRGTVFDVL